MKLLVDAFKIVLRIIIIATVTIHAFVFGLHPQFARMREGGIITRMTINAAKAPVIGFVKQGGIHDMERIHPFPDFTLCPFIIIMVIFLPMALQA
jgi:hypothetical protein